MDHIKRDIAAIFTELADGLETGQLGKKTKVAVIGPGSRLGEDNVMEGCKIAAARGIEVLYLGTAEAEGSPPFTVTAPTMPLKKWKNLTKNG